MSMNDEPLLRRHELEATVPLRKARLDALTDPDFAHSPETLDERAHLEAELDQDEPELDRLRAWTE